MCCELILADKDAKPLKQQFKDFKFKKHGGLTLFLLLVTAKYLTGASINWRHWIFLVFSIMLFIHKNVSSATKIILILATVYTVGLFRFYGYKTC